ncbi:secreted protein/lipoprotein [Streptomyces sp. ISL-43]|nr:secreted protein/lipoprotein [Streptomyces sp. ISL-43]
MAKLYADPSGTGANLKQYAASTALDSAETDAKRAHGQNLIYTGDVVVGSPTVTQINLDQKVPSASLTTCLDISQWQVLDAGTKEPVPLPSSRLTKYVITSVVERWPEGWRVIRDEPQGRPC